MDSIAKDDSRHGRRFILTGALVLNAIFVFAANFLAFDSISLQNLATNTNGWLSQTLVVNAVGIALIIYGWIVLLNRTPLQALGLTHITLARGITVFAIAWIGIQIIAASETLISGKSLSEISPDLNSSLPVLLGQLAGNALYEETFYRGYLISALEPEVGNRKWVAVIVSSVIFGIIHVANYWVRGLPMGLIIPATLAGILFGFVYIRTRNLWLCIGLHSLINVPVSIWITSLPVVAIPVLGLIASLIVGPLLGPNHGVNTTAKE